MTDDELSALCIWSESAGEPHDGKVAVGKVIRNRMDRRYQSDGTVEGTVLHNSAFSGFWFEFVGGKYTRVCHSLDEAKARAEDMLTTAEKQHIWQDCSKAWAESATDTELDDDVVSYVNLSTSNPSWATPDKFVTKIGEHSFYSV